MWKCSICKPSEWVLSYQTATLVTGNIIVELEWPWSSGINVSVPNIRRGSATLTVAKNTVAHISCGLQYKHRHPTSNYFQFYRRQKFHQFKTHTLHLPDFKWGHLIGALNQMLPELLQLFLKFRITCPDKYNTCYQGILLCYFKHRDAFQSMESNL